MSPTSTPVAGPPPAGPPRQTTAPTGSAMPVTEGMPVAWPLPTSSMQKFSTNQAVAAGNKAVIDASAGGPSAVIGEPMPQHELAHVKNVLDMLLSMSSQDGNAKKRDDIAKRLEELYTKLEV